MVGGLGPKRVAGPLSRGLSVYSRRAQRPGVAHGGVEGPGTEQGGDCRPITGLGKCLGT